MSRGANYAKIKSVFPDITDPDVVGRDEAEELERSAEKLDKVEAIEKFIKSKDGDAFRDHFVLEISKTLNSLMTSKDNDEIRVYIERLRSLTGFYKMLLSAPKEAETRRNSID